MTTTIKGRESEKTWYQSRSKLLLHFYYIFFRYYNKYAVSLFFPLPFNIIITFSEWFYFQYLRFIFFFYFFLLLSFVFLFRPLFSLFSLFLFSSFYFPFIFSFIFFYYSFSLFPSIYFVSLEINSNIFIFFLYEFQVKSNNSVDVKSF